MRKEIENQRLITLINRGLELTNTELRHENERLEKELCMFKVENAYLSNKVKALEAENRSLKQKSFSGAQLARELLSKPSQADIQAEEYEAELVSAFASYGDDF